VTPGGGITTALNKEAAQRPGANNGGRRNENRRRISIGLADGLCNTKLGTTTLADSSTAERLLKSLYLKAQIVK